MSKAKVTFPSAPDTSAIDIEDEGSLIVSNPTAMNFTGPGVTVTENPSGTAEVDIPGLQYWTESEDATTQQSTIFTPNNAATDVNAVLLPKGNGANTAQTPDGTTAGGNARGVYATDWQKRRLNANQVASGAESVICGGLDNRASGNQSFVGGGEGNTASGAESFVGGGGGNTASGTRSTVIGGNNCNASGVNSVAGGDQANASGFQSVCIGTESVATGTQSTSIGRQSRATANLARATTGGNQAEAPYANASGGGAKNRNAYSNVFAAALRASGDAAALYFSGRTQEGIAILGYNSRLTGGTNPPQLQASASTFYLQPGSNQNTGVTGAWFPAKDNQFFTFQIKLLATVTAITGTATGVNVGDVKQWNFEGSGKVVSGTVTILNAGTTDVIIYEDSGLASMSAQFIVGSLAQSIGVEMTNATFAGGGSLELLVNGFLYFQETSLD